MYEQQKEKTVNNNRWINEREIIIASVRESNEDIKLNVDKSQYQQRKCEQMKTYKFRYDFFLFFNLVWWFQLSPYNGD